MNNAATTRQMNARRCTFSNLLRARWITRTLLETAAKGERMKTLHAGLGALALLLLGTTASAEECNRDCLKKHLDTYLAAVANHKPEAGNLWVGFRQTENSVVIP